MTLEDTRVVSVVAGDPGGLTAYYVKSSIVRLLIDDDHPFVSWEVGVIVNHSSVCNFRTG
jgi:hypothetical protein